MITWDQVDEQLQKWRAGVFDDPAIQHLPESVLAEVETTVDMIQALTNLEGLNVLCITGDYLNINFDTMYGNMTRCLLIERKPVPTEIPAEVADALNCLKPFTALVIPAGSGWDITPPKQSNIADDSSDVQ